MNRIAFVADDAGFTTKSDDAILRCAERGVVRGASLVANGATTAAFARRARGLGLGWHVNLTEGPALAGVAPSLTDARGFFNRTKQELWAGAPIDPDEVRAEVAAQHRRLGELGIETTRVDGHNHVHLLPVVFAALQPLVGARRVRRIADGQLEFHPAAVPGNGVFTGFGFMEEPTRARLLADLPAAAADVEFMVHPGCRAGTRFTESPDRERECAVLCDPELPAALRDRGYEIGEPCGSR